jgi:iron complex transport system ATP-binding protein
MNIACLLTQTPDIALLDEPGNHLDLQHQIETLSLVRQQYENRVLLMSAHDINLATRFCTHALLLFGNGEFIQGPLSEVLNTSNLQRLYGIPIEKVETPTQTFFYPQ